MNLKISKGIGHGPTELAAFDQALVNAGVANFNLILLSSVLPQGSQVVERGDTDTPPGNWGDRLYVVMAHKRTSRRDEEVWAGIGWIQDETGKGLLVEHEGHTEEQVRADITHSLRALQANRNQQFGEMQMIVTGVRCEDDPVCALAVAVFESEPWQSTQ